MQIEARDLNLIYDINKEEHTYALRDVSLSLGNKNIIGVTGPSGSGKSSLLYVLAGLKSPTSGTVYYDDVDVESISANERAKLRKKAFGFIFQRHFLIDYLTVLDNILVSINRNDTGSRKKAVSLLKVLDIAHLSDKKPYQLSGGQRQRVAIARALINDPDVIFADEPTASLDHKNAMEVMKMLENCRDRAAILVVTHDRTILENADRIVEMWDGRVK